MDREFWINLPVKDLSASKRFFIGLGFVFNEEVGTDTMLCMLAGEKQVPVILFASDVFSQIIQKPVAETSNSNEVLLSLDTLSREEVDEITERARAAGAEIWAEPSALQGSLYGSGFSDLDGHRWNLLFRGQ